VNSKIDSFEFERKEPVDVQVLIAKAVVEDSKMDYPLVFRPREVQRHLVHKPICPTPSE
jgi:hypothetical protein